MHLVAAHCHIHPNCCRVQLPQVREGLLKGLEQAGDTQLPTVILSRTFEGALRIIREKESAANPPWGVSQLIGSTEPTDQGEEFAAMVVAHPSNSSVNLLRHLLLCMQSNQHETENNSNRQGRVLLCIGPEGGWREEELNVLLSEGFTPVQLGDRILTTTTAIIVAVGQAAAVLDS